MGDSQSEKQYQAAVVKVCVYVCGGGWVRMRVRVEGSERGELSAETEAMIDICQTQKSWRRLSKPKARPS